MDGKEVIPIGETTPFAMIVTETIAMDTISQGMATLKRGMRANIDQARVTVGETYWRSGGAELAGDVGKRPITQIMPDFNVLEKNAGAGLAAPPTDSLLMVAGESHVRANGIEYAGPDVLRVSGAQLLKWNRAARTGRRNETSSVR
jgi:hypothetical protein